MGHRDWLQDWVKRSGRSAGRGESRLRLERLDDRITPATWDGGGANANWSNPLNWVGDVVPLPGEDLNFPNLPVTKYTTLNDLAPAASTFGNITITDPRYILNGNEVTLSGDIIADFGAVTGTTAATINLPLRFTAATPLIQTAQTASALTFTSSSRIILESGVTQITLDSRSQPVTGGPQYALTVSTAVGPANALTPPQNLVKIGTGLAVFNPGGVLSNSYSGTTFVNEGTLQLAGAGTTTIPGDLVVGDAFTPSAVVDFNASNQIFDLANVTVLGDGTLQMDGFTDQFNDLTLGSATGVGAQVTGTGVITLGGDITVDAGIPLPVVINNPIVLTSGQHVITVADVPNVLPELRILGAVTGPGDAELIVVGGGEVRLETASGAVAGNQFLTTVSNGTLSLQRTGTGTNGVVPGNITVGDGNGPALLSLRTSDAIANTTVVTLGNGGSVDFTPAGTATETLRGFAGASPSADVNLGLTTVSVAPTTQLTYAGTISGDGVLQVNGGTAAQILTGNLNLTGNNPIGIYSIRVSGTGQLDLRGLATGGGAGVDVSGTGRLYGTGRILQLRLNGATTQVIPGTVDPVGGTGTPGTLITDNLDFVSGDLVIRIAGPNSFGSLLVTNQVLGFGVFSDLQVSLQNGYAPTGAASFPIVQLAQPGTALPFGSQFFGLPEASTFTPPGSKSQFYISYQQGTDNNDVVITSTTTPTVTVTRAGDQPAFTTASTASFVASFSGPVQAITPPQVTVQTTGAVAFTSIQTQQLNDTTFRITVLGLTGSGTVAVSLDEGATFSRANVPSQPSVNVNNVVTVNAPVPPAPPPPPVIIGGGGFFGGATGPRTLVGAGVGGGGAAAVFIGRPQPVGQFRATGPAFLNGVRVATADFNADGVQDYVLGSGPGAATQVLVLDGRTGAALANFQPFEGGFTGGVYVAAGDVNGDGVPDVVVSPDEGGGPRVLVYSGAGFGVVADFLGIDDPMFRGGARVAVGDVNADGFADLVVAAGFGGGPRVAGYNGRLLAGGQIVKLFNDFFAFEDSLRNGTFVAVADVNGDGFGDVIAGGGPGGGPRVVGYNGQNLVNGLLSLQVDFFAGPQSDRGGVPVGVADYDADGTLDLITGTGPGDGSAVRAFPVPTLGSSSSPPKIADFEAFPGFDGGVFVG